MELATQNSKRCAKGLSKCIARTSFLAASEKQAWNEIKKKGFDFSVPECGGSYRVFNKHPSSNDIISSLAFRERIMAWKFCLLANRGQPRGFHNQNPRVTHSFGGCGLLCGTISIALRSAMWAIGSYSRVALGNGWYETPIELFLTPPRKDLCGEVGTRIGTSTTNF